MVPLVSSYEQPFPSQDLILHLNCSQSLQKSSNNEFGLETCLHIHTHLFSICPEYPLMFTHLLPTWWTLVNGKQTWPNAFIHICCNFYTWQMHTFICVWPSTFARCLRSLIILIILLFSFSFRIIKVSVWTMVYFQRNGWNSRRMMKILVWILLEFSYKHTGYPDNKWRRLLIKQHAC